MNIENVDEEKLRTRCLSVSQRKSQQKMCDVQVSTSWITPCIVDHIVLVSYELIWFSKIHPFPPRISLMHFLHFPLVSICINQAPGMQKAQTARNPPVTESLVDHKPKSPLDTEAAAAASLQRQFLNLQKWHCHTSGRCAVPLVKRLQQ